jgi:hypothetical protein
VSYLDEELLFYTLNKKLLWAWQIRI